MASDKSRRYVYIQILAGRVGRPLSQPLPPDREKLHGYTASSEQIGWAAPIYVAETDARAKDESKIHIERCSAKYLNLPSR